MISYFRPDEERKGAYIGGGIGFARFGTFGRDEQAPYIPAFVGYQGKRLFFDVGADLFIVPSGAYPFPTLRTGFRF